MLDGDDWNAAEEAQAALESRGSAVLEPLLQAAPGFRRFGRLCAIELFEKIGDARAGSVLIPMLRDDHDAVRTPLDWSEPEALRAALTDLGARREVLPQRVAELAVSEPMFPRAWPVEHLPEVIERLADARQLVLYFMHWSGSPPWVAGHPEVGPELVAAVGRARRERAARCARGGASGRDSSRHVSDGRTSTAAG